MKRYLLALTLVACGRLHGAASPDEHPIATLRVAACGWDSYNLGLLRDAMARVASAGVRVIEAPCGAIGAVRLEHWESTDRCATSARYWLDGSRIQLDPVCTPGYALRRAVAMHEILHAAGARHVCSYPGELPDDVHPGEACGAVPPGVALLNPYTPSCEGVGPDGEPRVCVFLDSPTPADRAAVARAHGAAPP